MRYCILLLAFLYSCTGGRELAGVYWSPKSPCKFRINKDSTFSYEYRFQFISEHATGTWRREGKNKYILNSFVKSKRLPVSVNEAENNIGSNNNFLSAIIHIPDQAYYTCEIFINDTLYEKRSCDSLYLIPIATRIKQLFFGITADQRMPGRALDTLYTQPFYPRSEYSNKLKVDISYTDSFFNYRIFNNKAIRIVNRKLMFYDDKYSRRRILRKS